MVAFSTVGSGLRSIAHKKWAVSGRDCIIQTYGPGLSHGVITRMGLSIWLLLYI